MKHSLLFSLVMLAAAGLRAAPAEPAAELFELKDVRLLEGPFLDAQERGKRYILRVDVDRLLHWWRVKNGLPSSVQPYGEWTEKDYAFQGHYEGHYLSACAEMYAATGDVRFKENLDKAVAILAECQAQHPSGYLSVFPEAWIREMSGLVPKPNPPRRLPVPWYALHKVYQGLIDAHVMAGNAQARDVMVKMAEWMDGWSKEVGDEAFQTMLDEEHGGINEAMANLYAVTKDPRHLALAKRFCHRRVMDPLARGEDVLDGLHANTQVPKFTGFARVHDLDGGKEYADAARNFWRVVVEERSYVNGGNSDREKFTPKASLSHALSNGNTETCNTHNMLKLTRRLFRWSPSAAVADYHEHALINHILSSQSPESGTVAYFHGLEGGSRKGFSDPNRVTFACCHGSGLENPAKYGDSVYFRRGGSDLWVNLFLASEVSWREAGLVVRQETRFPEEERTTLTIASGGPAKATLRVRRPGWAGSGFAVTVNGAAVPAAAGADGYVALTRTWSKGDRVAVALPMTFRWAAFRDNPARAAVMRGPVLMVAKADEGCRMATVLKPRDRALATVKPVDGVLRFTADPAVFRRDVGEKPVEFQPMYRTVREFYSVYWDEEDAAQRAAAQRAYEAEVVRWKALAPATVDVVYHGMATPMAANNLPGRLAADPAMPRTAGADRTEEQHDLEAQKGYQNELNLIQRSTAGLWQTFRTVEKGMPQFGWTLAVEPGKAQTLVVRLWSPPSGDPEARRATDCGLDVRVAAVSAGEAVVAKPGEEKTTEGNQLATGGAARKTPPLRSVGTIGPAPADGRYREVRLPLPPDLTAGADRVLVRFVRQGGAMPGLVGEVRVVRD